MFASQEECLENKTSQCTRARKCNAECNRQVNALKEFLAETFQEPVAGSQEEHLRVKVEPFVSKMSLKKASNNHLCLQLFREKLSYKREPYATMPKVIMGNGGFTIA